MGMLTDKELVTAFINNTSDGQWDWQINASYKIDEETARAIREELLSRRGVDFDCALRE